MTVACVWVSADAGVNLKIGLEQNIWGWTDHAWSQSATAKVGPHLRSGDWLMLGQGLRGGPRQSVERWLASRISDLYLARISRGYYRSEERVWSDELYPHRVDLEQPIHRTGIGVASIGVAAVKAFRYSGTQYGCPVPVPDEVLEGFGIQLPDEEAEEALDRLAGDTPLERYALRLIRAEQSRLRRLKFGRLELAACDVCEVRLPVPLLRLAHIKRRASCSEDERRNLSNVMAACTFGCDELFERGLLVVDASGTWDCPVLDTIPEGDLRTQVSSRISRRCRVWNPATSVFFDAHREFHAVRASAAPDAWSV